MIDPLALILVIAVAAVAALVTLAVYRSLSGHSAGGETFEDALAKMTGTEDFSIDTSLAKTSKSSSFSWNKYWATAFEKAGRKVADPSGPGRMMLVFVVVAIFFGLAVWPGGVYFGFIPVLVVAGMSLYLSLVRGRRKGQLEQQLPLLLSGLRTQMQAGLTAQGAILAVADELPAPLGDEIRIVKADVSVSVPLDVALQSLAERSQSRIMKFLVSSMGIAIRSGQDLIPQLVVIEETVRQRARIQGKIRSALAMAKPTAYISMAAPLALGAWMFITDPTYPAFYFGPNGFIMLLIAAMLYAAGVFTVFVMVSNVEKV